MSQRSLDVEYLHTVIASLEVALQDKEDDTIALNRWIENKKAQCVKCKIGQKKVKDELAALKARKMNPDAIAQQRMMGEPFPMMLGAEEAEDTGCGCGGNFQVEGEDCKC